jgi:hypothetical protein
MALPDNTGIRIRSIGWSRERYKGHSSRHDRRTHVVSHFRTSCKDCRGTGTGAGRKGGRVIPGHIAYNIRISCDLAPPMSRRMSFCYYRRTPELPRAGSLRAQPSHLTQVRVSCVYDFRMLLRIYEAVAVSSAIITTSFQQASTTNLFHLFVVLSLDGRDFHSQILLQFLYPSIRVGITDKVDGHSLSAKSTGSPCCRCGVSAQGTGRVHPYLPTRCR